VLATGVLLVASACSAGDDGAQPDKETFCAKLAEFNAGTAAFDLNVADDAEIERVAQLLADIEASAPEEILEDVVARFAYVDEVIAASQGDEDAAARLAEASPTDEEQARIDAYAQQECGIALEPPTSAPPTTVSGVVPAPTVPATVAPDTTATTAPVSGDTTVTTSG
ncbi:MAG TPA: hypothetical protein PKA98_08505, partial [Acidimicrobiales bacterium]|nr:hypothetical protein [Acidimicrobiales bacterium]